MNRGEPSDRKFLIWREFRSPAGSCARRRECEWIPLEIAWLCDGKAQICEYRCASTVYSLISAVVVWAPAPSPSSRTRHLNAPTLSFAHLGMLKVVCVPLHTTRELGTSVLAHVCPASLSARTREHLETALRGSKKRGEARAAQRKQGKRRGSRFLAFWKRRCGVSFLAPCTAIISSRCGASSGLTIVWNVAGTQLGLSAAEC